MFNNLPEDVLVMICKNVFQDCLDDIKDQKVFETCYGDDIEFIYKIVELDNDSLRRCFRLFMETYDLYIKELKKLNSYKQIERCILYTEFRQLLYNVAWKWNKPI